jgi:hypothetical protein
LRLGGSKCRFDASEAYWIGVRRVTSIPRSPGDSENPNYLEK